MTEHKRPPRIIALMNQKGGVGKTTTTVNLGAALAELGHRVLFVDLDPQAHLTLHLGIDPTDPEQTDATVYDLLVDDETSPFDLVREAGENMAVIGAEVDLAAAEHELAAADDRNDRLRTRLAPVLEAFDFVLIDCPPSLGLLTINALAMAGEVIVPMQAHFLALQGLSKLLETVQLVRQQMNPKLRVSGVVLAMHDRQTNLATEVVEDLRGFFEASRKMAMPWSDAVIYEPPIRRNIKLAECPSFGQTIFEYEPHCAGARDYERLAKSVVAQSNTKPSSPGPALERVVEPVEQVPEANEPPTPQIETVAAPRDPVSEPHA